MSNADEEELDLAMRNVSVLSEGNVPGGVVPFNEVKPLVEEVVELRRHKKALLKLVATMGRLDAHSENLLREAGIDPDLRFGDG